MAIRYENQCVGCPHERGCLGEACRYRNVPVLVCDECGDECEEGELRECDGEEICMACLLKRFPAVEVE